MKKFAYMLAVLCLLSACSEKSEEQDNELNQAETPKYEETVFAYKMGELNDNCSAQSPMVCAIDLAVKCTIDPKRADCAKKQMPGFIFMEDESLQRPTEMTFRIYKLKPLNDGTVEVYTDSTCNGNWFGLCQGNIIYVMKPMGENWMVHNIYALATPAPTAK